MTYIAVAALPMQLDLRFHQKTSLCEVLDSFVLPVHYELTETYFSNTII